MIISIHVRIKLKYHIYLFLFIYFKRFIELDKIMFIIQIDLWIIDSACFEASFLFFKVSHPNCSFEIANNPCRKCLKTVGTEPKRSVPDNTFPLMIISKPNILNKRLGYDDKGTCMVW